MGGDEVESRALMNEISALVKEVPEKNKGAPDSFLSLPPCEDTGEGCPSTNQEGGTPDTKSASPLILDFSAPAPRAGGNKSLWFISCPVCGIWCSALSLSRAHLLFPHTCSLSPSGTSCSSRTEMGCGGTHIPSSQRRERGSGCSSHGLPSEAAPQGWTRPLSLSPGPPLAGCRKPPGAPGWVH